MAAYAGHRIAVSLEGAVYHLTPEERRYRVTYQGLIIAFHAAIIGQKRNALDALGMTDLDRLKGASLEPGDEYAFNHALFLQNLHDKGAPHLKQLLAVSDAIDEQKMHPLTFDYALRVVGPQVNLLTSLFTNDEDAFNRQLPEALALHSRYYSRSEEDADNSDGLVSIALSALKRLALLQGFKVTTSSEHLTEVLFDG